MKTKQDYSPQQLPKNRTQVFFDAIKTRSSTLLSLGVTALLFAIPLIALTVFANLKIQDIASATGDKAEIAVAVFKAENTFNLLKAIGWGILGVGTAGVFGVIRRLVWQEGILFGSDFRSAVKDNGFTYFIVFFIAGLLRFFVVYTFLDPSTDGWGQTAFIVAIVISVLYAPTIPFMLVQSTVYSLPFGKKFFNSFMLAMRTFFITLPVTVLDLSWLLLLLIPNGTVYISVTLILPLVIIPLASLFTTLYCDSVLDKFVNKEHFPEIVNKGVYHAQDND